MWFTWITGSVCTKGWRRSKLVVSTKTTCRFTTKMAEIYSSQFLKLSSFKNMCRRMQKFQNSINWAVRNGRRRNAKLLLRLKISPMNSSNSMPNVTPRKDMRLAAIRWNNKNSNRPFRTRRRKTNCEVWRKLRKTCKRINRWTVCLSEMLDTGRRK